MGIISLVTIYGCRHSTDPQPTTVPATPINFDQSLSVQYLTTASVALTSVLTVAPTGQLTVGHVWSKTSTQPTLADSKSAQVVSVTSLPYSVTTTLTGLSINDMYYIRPYATAAGSTTYGTVQQLVIKPGLADFFALTLADSLQGRNIGYGYVIFDGNTLKTSGQGGLKSRTVDPEGEKPYTIDTKMHIASMSKTIAAMAFTQVLIQKGLKTTDKIAPYLPASWPKGPNIDQITFRQLFNHRSGIIGLGNDCANGSYTENIYSGLKQLIANGVKTANLGQYCYQNANIGLFRILIPALTGYQFTGTDATDDAQTQQLYLTYVQTNVFSKIGLTGITPTYPAGNPTYAYDYPYSGRQGWNPGNFLPTLGAYGWYMTPREAGTLYASVLSSTDQSILPTAYKDTLLLNNLGCFRAVTSLGDLAYHDGWWYYSSTTPYYGLRTIWMKLPNNLTVVLFVNALNRQTGLFPSNDGTDIVTFVFRAYSRARQLSGARIGVATIELEHPEPH